MKQSSRGFTMIELMISAAVFVVMFSVMMVGFNRNSQQRTLNDNALLIVDGLRRVQTMALSGSQVTNDFSPDSYYFSLDSCLSDCSYKLLAKNGGDELVIEEVLLSPELSVTNDSLLVGFNLPRANMSINSAGEDVSRTTISLSYDSDGLERCVSLSTISGKMEITSCL